MIIISMNTNFPKTEPIMSIPAVQPTAPLVPSDVDHKKINLSIAPGNQWYEKNTFCNVLPPAPRDQLINYPLSKKNCKKYKNPKYKNDTYYFTFNKDQNVEGIFSGGDNNDNFVRGNQFSNECGKDYVNNSNKIISIGDNILNIKNDDIHIDEYSINAQKPVQKKMEEVLFKDNETIVSDSPFYPYPNFNYTKNKKYIEYPHSKNYTDSGMPIYTYPYNTLTRSPIKEHFESGNACVNKRGLLIGLIIILILLILVLFLGKK